VDLADENKTQAKAVVPACEKFSKGDTIWFHFAPEIIHLFDGDTPIIKR